MPESSEPAKPAPGMNRWHAAAVLVILVLGVALTAAVLQVASLGWRDSTLCQDARRQMGFSVFEAGEAAGRADKAGFGNLSSRASFAFEVMSQTCALSADEKGFYVRLDTALMNLQLDQMSETHVYLWQDPSALSVVHDALFGPNYTTPGIGFLVRDNLWQDASALLHTLGQDLTALGYRYIVPD